MTNPVNGGRFGDLRTIYQGCRALPFALAGLSCWHWRLINSFTYLLTYFVWLHCWAPSTSAVHVYLLAVVKAESTHNVEDEVNSCLADVRSDAAHVVDVIRKAITNDDETRYVWHLVESHDIHSFIRCVHLYSFTWPCVSHYSSFVFFLYI